AVVDAGSRYLRAVGPFYGLFGLGLALYFASVGAGRLLWPLLANLARLVIATVGGWLALHWGGEIMHVFLALGIALAVFGLINAAAVAGGAWFGPVGWPRMSMAWSHAPDTEECDRSDTEGTPHVAVMRHGNASICSITRSQLSRVTFPVSGE